MFIADIKGHIQYKIKLFKPKCYNVLQYNIEHIIFKYKSQSVDYNKIETSRIWHLTVLPYHTTTSKY